MTLRPRLPRRTTDPRRTIMAAAMSRMKAKAPKPRMLAIAVITASTSARCDGVAGLPGSIKTVGTVSAIVLD